MFRANSGMFRADFGPFRGLARPDEKHGEEEVECRLHREEGGGEEVHVPPHELDSDEKQRRAEEESKAEVDGVRLGYGEGIVDGHEHDGDGVEHDADLSVGVERPPPRDALLVVLVLLQKKVTSNEVQVLLDPNTRTGGREACMLEMTSEKFSSSRMASIRTRELRMRSSHMSTRRHTSI